MTSERNWHGLRLMSAMFALLLAMAFGVLYAVASIVTSALNGAWLD